jgi:2'-5' RNA ligase
MVTAPIDRLYLAFVAEPPWEEPRHPHAPAHLTLAPPFAASVEVAAGALAAGVAGLGPFTVRATGQARFGPRGDIPVLLVAPVERLRLLHERLIGELARRGVDLVGDRHIHDRFSPHIRVRPAVTGFPAIAAGQEFVIDHVALMRSGTGLVVTRIALGAARA